jgi:hypothetical protein
MLKEPTNSHILNKQSQTSDEGPSCCFGVERGANNASRFYVRLKCYVKYCYFFKLIVSFTLLVDVRRQRLVWPFSRIRLYHVLSALNNNLQIYIRTMSRPTEELYVTLMYVSLR